MDPKWNEDQPIYRQLRDRVVAMILEGVLGDGDALPSVRNVAAALPGQIREKDVDSHRTSSPVIEDRDDMRDQRGQEAERKRHVEV